MKIKFTRNYTVQDGTGKTYQEGEIVDFVDASARHFLNRDAAIEHVLARGRPKKKADEPAEDET